MPTPTRRNRLNAHWLAALCAAAVLMGSTHARASSSSDDDEVPDARVAGYATDVSMKGSAAGSFAILTLLTAVSVGIMFKNANRSHLD